MTGYLAPRLASGRALKPSFAPTGAQHDQELLGCRSERRVAHTNAGRRIPYLPSANGNHREEACPHLLLDCEPTACCDTITPPHHELNGFPRRQLQSALRRDPEVGKGSLHDGPCCRPFLAGDPGEGFELVA